MEVVNFAGMSIKGGRRDNFFLSLLEYYPKHKRWFLKSLTPARDEKNITHDEIIKEWIDKYTIEKLVVDTPLSLPKCQTCTLDCPGTNLCPVEDVKIVKRKISETLEDDAHYYEKNPKAYERERNEQDYFDISKNIFDKHPSAIPLSKSFKRRLKKDFIPYWNRPVDFWIWKEYYDYLLGLFDISYDSFGSTSLMLQSKFTFLRRRFPKSLGLFESLPQLVLVELIRAEKISIFDVKNLKDLDLSINAKANILRDIEKNLDIFIYEHDLETLLTNPRALDSFLLALLGPSVYKNQYLSPPSWAESDSGQFMVPKF